MENLQLTNNFYRLIFVNNTNPFEYWNKSHIFDFFRKYNKILFDLQEKKNIYAKKKNMCSQKKKKAKYCIVKGDIPKLCIRITHKYKKKKL